MKFLVNYADYREKKDTELKAIENNVLCAFGLPGEKIERLHDDRHSNGSIRLRAS
jgi:hypothetical protein